MDTKVSKNRQRKQALVEEISQKVSKAKALIFTNYQGLTHKQLEGFKKAIKPLDGEYVVAKNTLVLRSLEKAGVKIENPASLDGPTGTMFLYGDVAEPLKSLAKIIKEFNLPTVKFGILDSQALTSEQVLKIAALPSRDTLIAQFVGSLKAPIYGLHRALSWNLQKLVLTLNEISKTKPALAVASAAPVAAPVPVPAIETASAANTAPAVSEPEPEMSEAKSSEGTILAETKEEKQAEEPKVEENKEKVKSEGGEN